MLGRGPGSYQVPPRVLPQAKPPVAESSPSSSSPPSSCRPHLGPCTWFSSSVLACVFQPPSECRDPTPHSNQPKPGHLPRCLFPPLPHYRAARSHAAEDRLTFSNTRPSLPGAAVTAGLRRQCDLSRLEAEVQQQVWAELRRLWERMLPASCSSWGSRHPGIQASRLVATSLLSLLCGHLAPCVSISPLPRRTSVLSDQGPPSGLVFIRLYPQRPYFQLRSHARAPGVRTEAYILGDTIHQSLLGAIVTTY